MGYYTSHTLTLEHIDEDQPVYMDHDEIIEQFRDEYDEAAYALTPDGSRSESCKWYDHQNDLVEFSKLFPEFLFILEGEGEEPGDLWKLYVKNGKGKKVRAKIVFDEVKLTDLI